MDFLQCELKYKATIAMNCPFLLRPECHGSKQFHLFYDKSDASNCRLLEKAICASMLAFLVAGQ